jgi:hypothetical protein
MLTLLTFIGEAVRDAFDPRKLPGGAKAAAAAAPASVPVPDQTRGGAAADPGPATQGGRAS